MIKNKKYTHTKGGKIKRLDFDKNTKINSIGERKKYIKFDLTIDNFKKEKFKISTHTFAHFDEFKNNALNEEIKKFTHIIQYFVVFIFLLDSMHLSETDFINRQACKGEKTRDGNCYITKEGNYKGLPFDLTIYITNYNPSRIFITSLFDKYDKSSNFTYPNISYQDIVFNKNDEIIFSHDTIKTLFKMKDNIINNNYDIANILSLLNNSSATKPPPSPPSSRPKKNTSSNPILPIEYHFSIPKNSGGKKHKTKSSKKRQKKRRGRKTRKK